MMTGLCNADAIFVSLSYLCATPGACIYEGSLYAVSAPTLSSAISPLECHWLHFPHCPLTQKSICAP